MFSPKLRTKFLLALALILALLTAATLFAVRARVQIQVRQQLEQDLDASINVFRVTQQQREETLERSAALLASLPPLMAVMTSQDTATIQDASRTFWKLSGSQVFTLSDPQGNVMALHSPVPGVSQSAVEGPLKKSLEQGRSKDWWFSGGHLFQVFLQPVYFGASSDNPQIGILALGFELDEAVSESVAQAAHSQVLFRYGDRLTTSSLGGLPSIERISAQNTSSEVTVGSESYLARTVRLSEGTEPAVTLTVLKSFDQATRFLASINRWILGVGLAGVLIGGWLVYLVATSFTQPLGELVAGVRALESGDFAYPLRVRGRDEVSSLTSAFDRMRGRLRESQQQVIAAERLATIGRVATSISHDLRHPLTAILAYAEFLAEPSVTESQRKDFFQEIRIAVNRMTEELNSLLGFSKQAGHIRPAPARLDETIDRAIQSVKVLPEFERVKVHHTAANEGAGVFDANKIERVVLNLVLNACEAVSPDNGVIQVSSGRNGANLEVVIKDNGPGFAPEVLGNLFQPFATYGKEEGIGLGLTVVQKIIQDHGGTVTLTETGLQGSMFRLQWPAEAPAAVTA